MRIGIYRLLLVLVLVCSGISTVHAASFGGIREATLYPFIQYFTWEEFRTDGSRLLKESGPQYGIGGTIKLNLLQGSAGAWTLNSKTEMFGGVVDYDGTTFSSDPVTDNRPVKTDVNYFGISEDLDLGWAIPVQKITVEPFAGVGYRWWMRDLESSTSVGTNGVPFAVSGYTEHWRSFSFRAGARSQYPLSENVTFSVMAAARYPFHNRNNIDVAGVGKISLEPKSEWSAIAEAGLRYKRIVATVYYESFIFPDSAPVAGFYQPRSESEIVGLRLGWAFK